MNPMEYRYLMRGSYVRKLLYMTHRKAVMALILDGLYEAYALDNAYAGWFVIVTQLGAAWYHSRGELSK